MSPAFPERNPRRDGTRGWRKWANDSESTEDEITPSPCQNIRTTQRKITRHNVIFFGSPIPRRHIFMDAGDILLGSNDALRHLGKTLRGGPAHVHARIKETQESLHVERNSASIYPGKDALKMARKKVKGRRSARRRKRYGEHPHRNIR